MDHGIISSSKRKTCTVLLKKRLLGFMFLFWLITCYLYHLTNLINLQMKGVAEKRYRACKAREAASCLNIK